MKVGNKGLAILNIILAILFLFAAGVQYNDPDMYKWMFIYGGAALSSILWFSDYFIKAVPMVILVVALLWAGFLLPDVLDHGLAVKQTMETFKMTNTGVELAREFGGLIIVVIWMGILLSVSD